MTEQLGAMLVRRRQEKGHTQLSVAEGLCAASGVTTVTRHEVSRWERQERIPSAFWLRWLAEVLDVSMTELEAAAAVTRKEGRASTTPVARIAQPPAPKAITTPLRGSGDDPLSRVTIEFEHRTTSVRLSATYDDPRRAVLAIEAFPSMVGDGEPVRAQPEHMQAGARSVGAGALGAEVQGGAARPAGQAMPVQRQRPSAPAALTARESAGVPMGIRYTRGPGAG